MSKKSASSEIHVKKNELATNPEARDNQMISLAIKETERRIRNHTASTGLLIHYLKLGTQQKKLEQEKLQHENELLRAKTQALESASDSNVLYEKVLKAMKEYSGVEEDDNLDFDE